MRERVRILFIEQEQKGVLAYKQLLNSGELENFLADFASSGKEGLSLYKSGVHQVVIVGHPLGEFTATDVIETLLNDSESPPIIVVTGQEDEHLAVELLGMGVTEYLVKDDFGMYLKLLPKAINRSLNERYLRKQKQDALVALRESHMSDTPLIF